MDWRNAVGGQSLVRRPKEVISKVKVRTRF